MTDDRKSGIALITGMAGTIITMALHPTGHDLISGHAASMMQLNVAVHTLALVCVPILFLGALGLTQRLASPNRLALSGLVLFGFAEVAVMIAAAASGLITPGLFHHMSEAGPAAADAWRAAMALNGHLNQAFALIFTVASSVAIVFWSAAILKSSIFNRALGIYGCILGPLTILGVLSGHIRLNVHGFGMVVIGQAVWFISAGVILWNEKQEPAQPTSP
ncbi:MAG: hypothetical protein LAO76_10900 [Acidobacteriia bacterium]|nr:hypothetical protein [Terriglobia bacterium]